MRLLMNEYLACLSELGPVDAAPELARHYHPKVVMAKAIKANRQGYAECGVNDWCSWITPDGEAFLQRAR